MVMTSPVEQIQVACPACGTVYEDWYRASLNLDLDHFEDDYIRDATTATCPECRHVVELDALVVDGGVWRFNGRRRPPDLETGAPHKLQLITDGWRLAGSPAQPPIEWPRERWITAFPHYTEALRALPALIDRQIVREKCQQAAADANSAQWAFIVVMAWGYGKQVGYGPWRTHRVLSQTTSAAERLATVAQTLVDDDAVAAYGRLAHEGDCNLRGLGPAFGTKYLYFCQPIGRETTALILDSLVAQWLRQETELHLNPLRWSVATYRKYLEKMHEWAFVLKCKPDDLEYCIFRKLATERGSQWG